MNQQNSPIKLVLGCGETRREGSLHIDQNELANPDIQHNLNTFPYPFEDHSVSHIEAFHIIEHLEDPFDVMRELHRILIPGGSVHIKVPHCSRGFTHSQHKSGFDVSFPLYFSKAFTKSGYFGVDFDLQSMKLNWLANMHLLPFIGVPAWQIITLKGLHRCITTLANLNPYVCSRFWVFAVGGFDEIEFKFTCKK
jgi:SAM-dependent methyltransferase